MLAGILGDVVRSYRNRNLEIVFVADGKFKARLKEVVNPLRLEDRVAICDFEERLARLTFGDCDYDRNYACIWKE